MQGVCPLLPLLAPIEFGVRLGGKAAAMAAAVGGEVVVAAAAEDGEAEWAWRAAQRCGDGLWLPLIRPVILRLVATRASAELSWLTKPSCGQQW